MEVVHILIAVVDDNMSDLIHIRELCKSFMRSNGIVGEVYAFSSGAELLKNGTLKFDIILLDVRMPELNGIQVGEKIRKTNAGVEIIYISAYVDYARFGYAVKASEYLLKDQLDESFCSSLSRIVKNIRAKKRYHFFKFVGAEMTLDLNEILYIASRGRRVIFFLTSDEPLREERCPYMNRTLNMIEDELGEEGFIRIDQSYLVNVQHIKSIRDDKTAMLRNGELLHMSRSRFAAVKKKYALLAGDF